MLSLGLMPGSAASATQDSSRPPKPAAPETLTPHPDWRPADKPLAPISVPSHPSPTMVAEPDPKARRVRELTARRTANGRYYQLSDGRVQAEISGSPVNYRDARGSYQPLDVRITGAGRAGYPHGVEKNTFRSYFGDRTDRMVRLEYGGTSLGLGTTAPTAVAPQVDGNEVTYRGALPGADVSYQVTPTELKERIVLAKPPADPSYTFRLDLAGLRPVRQPNGSIALYRADGEGPAVATIPKPYMTDSTADRGSPYGSVWSPKVSQELSADGTTLVVRADRGWLADPHREYPVVIDPTIKIQPTVTQSQDAMIISDSAASNFDGSWRLSVGTTTTGKARSLVRFGLGTIPTGTTISSASLQLYFDQDHTTGSYSVPLEAHRVTANWGESTVTWNSINTALGELGGTATKGVNQANVWHAYDVKSIVQSWVSGTQPNYGFMVKAADEATLGRGGPRYEAAEYAYNGETDNTPKLIVTYGRPGVVLDAPTTITATGADLHWSAYTDPNPADPNDDIVEYQVHRTVYQTFTPSASTLVAPVPAGTTSFSDTTANPTPADDPQPFGNAYYYMVAVKTRDGKLTPAATQLVRLPKAGRVVKVFQSGQIDTSLSSAQPDTNLNSVGGSPWVLTGNNSSTYGRTRSVVKFPSLSTIPASAQILDATYSLWGFTTIGSGATYEAHALNKDFDQNTATWNKANSTTTWTAGGDYNATVVDTVGNLTNDPAWRDFDITPTVSGWVTNPASNHGIEVKLANETTPGERTVFLSSEAAEPQLRPKLVVTYIEKTAASTYYAPFTPSRMIPGDLYTVDVTLTNSVNRTLTAADYVLSYHWALPDGTDVTTSGNQLDTPLTADLAVGASQTLHANLRTPIQSDSGNKRTEYVLRWELRNKTTGQWLSASDGIPSLDQNVSVEDPTSDQLGLEKFYQYAGTNTGAGTTAMVNLYAGNTVWNYNAFTNPSRGLATFTRLTYNSLDTSASSMGYGWSLAATTLTRLNTPLDLHPRGQSYPTDVTLTDGDGTSHAFTLNKHGSTDPAQWEYDHPAGVHLYLQKGSAADTSRAWVMTRPDRTQTFFDDEGYQTAIVDKNGNTLQFTYAERRSNNQPRKFLQYITDPANRQTLTLTYYAKGDSYSYIDDAGNEVQATNLTNPKIIDNVKTITDISGRQLALTYTDKGLMAKLVDGSGKPEAKTFRFTYDATNTNKNTKLVAVKDPRGNSTALTYYDTPLDPKFKWLAKSLTDRNGGVTGYAYTDPDGTSGSQIQTVTTDAENHNSTYLLDGYGRPLKLTNAKNELTQLAWDADNNVTRLQENNGAATTWTFDAKTGYPITNTDQEANKNGWGPTRFTYFTGLNGHIADLANKQSPEGRTWGFEYDAKGNLASVTDPAGSATPQTGDFTTTYTYDSTGQLLTSTDANLHTTTYSNYDPVGYPKTTTDALNKATTTVYDVRGNVLSVTDALGKTSSYTYDVFGRSLTKKQPKDQAAGVYINTPAPVYDPNDNVTQSTAPNGAVTTYEYDKVDRMSASVDPKDNPTDPERRTAYTYDKVGNLTSSTKPKGNLTPSDPNDFVTRQSYNAIYQLTAVTDALGHKISYDYDDVGNVVTVIDARKNATADTTDYSTKYTYDLDHRTNTITDAAGNVTRHGYDKDGKVVTKTDQAGNVTLLTLDARGLTTEAKVPHRNDTGTFVYHTVRYEYDQVGNKTKEITPRGVATTDDPDDFAQVTVYDAVNRVKEQVFPYDKDDPTYNKQDKVINTYDAVGRLTKVSNPPSDNQTVRNDTSTTYFDNGWTKSSTDPWDIVTTYDYNDLGRQTKRTVTSAGGSSSRTQTWDYYPDGKKKSHSDDGVPVGSQVVLVDNSDAQNTAVTGTWSTSSSGSGFQGYDYRTHAAGTGTNSFVWKLIVPQSGTYGVFVKYAAGTATSAPYKIDYNGGSVTKTVNQTTQAGQWVSIGSYSFAEGNSHKITLTDNGGGTVVADAVKLVRDNSADTDNEKKTYGYSYDPNGNLTKITDSSSGAQFDNYDVTFNGIDQVNKIEEKLGSTLKHTTTFTYDENANPLSRQRDSQIATYEYNVLDLVAKVTNKESATDPSPKVQTYTYTPHGDKLHEVKSNGNTVDYAYNLDWTINHQVEKKPGGTVVSEHTMEYDENSNKIKDTTKEQNADDHSAYLNRVATYTYDPRDRSSSVKKTDPGTGAEVSHESYTNDADSNVISQESGGKTTTFGYDRNRLQSSTTSGVTSSYNYDPFGRLDTVTALDKEIERYVYDGFDRKIEHRTMNAGTTTTSKYTYDPLDRTVTEVEKAGTPDEKTKNMAYLGLTDKLLSEENAADPKDKKEYQYSPWGERLSQTKFNTDGTKENNDYGYNPHTDVETLTDDKGDTKSTYGYTAYGQNDDKDFTGVDKPTATDPTKEPYNAYRFNSARWDHNSGNYDMGFRDYNPGLNRFLTLDAYNGALADMSLTTDPWTMNRYAFAGGNPISMVEIDGHWGFSSITHAIGSAVSSVTNAVSSAASTVADAASTAWSATTTWVSEHKAEIVGAVVGTVVGIGCEVATAGAGSLGCAALGGAVGNMVTYGMKTPSDQWTAGGFLTSGAVGAAAGVVGFGAGKVLAAGGSKVIGAFARDAAEGAEESAASSVARACSINSFTGSTPVLMANGKQKPIKQVKVGDKVKATDPGTGQTDSHTVTKVIVHGGKHTMVDIKLADGTSITTTDRHPFWDASTRRFSYAIDLKAGEQVSTSDGRALRISAVRVYRADVTAYNLTVETIHTYYAGVTPVLVHNSCGSEAAEDAAESARGLVERTAQGHADLGEEHLTGFLSEAEQAAYAEEPWLKPVFMGTAVHRATAQDLADQFTYRTIGPDFLHNETGTLVELTTPGQVAAHVARGGDYETALYATYRFGRNLLE
jgi:RHS repeat-associated protein